MQDYEAAIEAYQNSLMEYQDGNVKLQLKKT